MYSTSTKKIMPKSNLATSKCVEKDENNCNKASTLHCFYRPYLAIGRPNYKVILCGEYNVGKSSLFRRFMNNTFIDDQIGKISSIGLDTASQSFHVCGKDVKLTLWDTGGMERTSFVGQCYYRGAHAALLCYRSNKKVNISILSQYILEIVMNTYGAKVFLCGNFTDCDGADGVNETDMGSFTCKCGNFLSGSYRVSCKDGSGINEMFSDIARIIHQENANK